MEGTLTKDQLLSKMKTNCLLSIKCISLWGCDLYNVDILSELINLEVATLSANKISTLKPFSNCEKLSELHLRRNDIRSLDELSYLQDCKYLRILSLAENPCNKHPSYRLQVILTLPQILKLDNMPITDDERDLAKRLTCNFNLTYNNLSDVTTTDSDSKLKNGFSTMKSIVISVREQNRTPKIKIRSPTKKVFKSCASTFKQTDEFKKLDNKVGVISAIESLLETLDSPQLRYVKEVVDEKLK